MKVLHITTVHNPRDTRILYRQCQSLASEGYSVQLLACAETPFSVAGVEIIPLPRPASRSERMTVTAWKALRTALKLRADVYHFHDPELAPWMLVLKLLSRKPVIFDIHENIIANISNRAWIPGGVRWFLNAAVARVLPYLTRPFEIVFAESSYREAYPWIRRYTILHNFPDVTVFPAPNSVLKRNRFTIVYLGSISESRGILDLLDALKILQQKNIPVGALIIGRDDLGGDQKIEDRVAARNLKNVDVMPYIPQPKAIELVSQCHLGYAVLHPKENYISSYPTKMFEYMGCGLPVVTSNFPLYESVVSKCACGYLVQPKCPQQIASVIQRSMEDEGERKRFGENGRFAIEREFNWQNEERNLRALYEAL